MWDPREPPTWWLLGLALVVVGAVLYMMTALPPWVPWIPLGLGFLFFITGYRMRGKR